MNVIIIEGLDNTGKSTVINELKEKYSDKRIKIIHCEKPQGETHEEQSQFQNKFFIELAKELMDYKKSNEYDIVILDRAWYGEYVYGQLYREHNPLDIEQNIKTIEDMLSYVFTPKEISFILLNVSDIKFSVKHDDGLSISSANMLKIRQEKRMFERIFQKSNIKYKKNIFVNDELNFKSKETIFNEVTSIIKIK